MRPHSAWCPICFEDWKQNNQPIYEPLIWKLKVINVCPSHQTLLQTKCQNCQKILPQLSSRSQPGYCSKCYQWLGIKKDDIHDIDQYLLEKMSLKILKNALTYQQEEIGKHSLNLYV